MRYLTLQILEAIRDELEQSGYDGEVVLNTKYRVGVPCIGAVPNLTIAGKIGVRRCIVRRCIGDTRDSDIINLYLQGAGDISVELGDPDLLNKVCDQVKLWGGQ